MRKQVFKIFAVITAIVLVTFSLAFLVSAEGEQEEVVGIEVVETEETQKEETAVAETEDNGTWFDEAWDFVKQNCESIIVILSAIYVALPKYGGIAKLIALVKSVKYFFDDKNNKKSVYNVMAGTADAVTAFMTQYADKIDKLERFIPYLAQLEKFMGDSKEEKEQIITTVTALTTALDLIAKQCNTLVSISPNATARDKELFDEEWVRDRKKLNAAIEAAQEVCNDGKA